MERLGLAIHRQLIWKLLSERPEAPTGIDVIHDDYTVRSKNLPGHVQFETNIAFAVQTVVNEEINLAKSRDQLGKVAPARTLDVCPSI